MSREKRKLPISEEYRDIVEYYTKVNEWAYKRMNKK
jgi:hypothetical protein